MPTLDLQTPLLRAKKCQAPEIRMSHVTDTCILSGKTMVPKKSNHVRGADICAPVQRVEPGGS